MVNVIGLGYIGLPTALILAKSGVAVVGTDYDGELVEALNAGKPTFQENGLEELFQQAVQSGVRFTQEYQQTDCYIISVPTPYDKTSKKIDPCYVVRAVDEVLNVCLPGAVLILESTVSPGTMDRFIRPLVIKRGFLPGRDIHLAHAPERIIPGNMLHELEENSRTVGVESAEIGERVRQLYATFCRGEIVLTDIRTAEMTKVVENTYRDINIAFANELAKICRFGGMDVHEIIRIANKHPRVNILSPGPGVGGHCISVDPWFLVGDYPGLANMILAARKINDSMPEFVLERIYEIMEKEQITQVSKIGLYGLTYKEDVDDVRESPTLQMLDCMRRHLASGVRVYDPFVTEDLVPNQYHDLDLFLEGTELVVLLVGHSEIRRHMKKLKEKKILDTRRICPFDGVYQL